MFNLKLSKTMKDVQWSFISLVTASFSHLLLRIVLGRELGPSGLGIYTLVFTIYLFGMQFAAFGIGAALTKHIAEFSDDLVKTKRYISSGIIGSLITGLLMGIMLYILAGIISINIFNIPEMTILLKMTALCFPFIAMHKVISGALNGFRSMKAFAFLNISLNASVLFISLFFVLFLDMDIFGAVLGFVIPTIIWGFISIFFVRSKLIFLGSSFLQNDILKDIFYFGFYAALAQSIGYVYTQIDSMMIGYYLNQTEVGYYAIAILFMQGIILIASAIQRVTSPIIVKKYAKKEYESLIKLLKTVPLKVFLISLLFSLIIVIFGKTIIITFFGNEFLPAYQPLTILLIGYTTYSAYSSVGTFFQGTGHVKLSYKLAIASATLNIILNVILVPIYGIIGAAIATSASIFIMTTIKTYLIILFIKNGWTF